jgi:hypothetical protein
MAGFPEVSLAQVDGRRYVSVSMDEKEPGPDGFESAMMAGLFRLG